MDTLPPELISKIFEYACTDGGATVKALRATNHRLSAIVEPLQFRTIAIRGESQLVGFLSRLVSLAPGLRRVESLYVYVNDEDDYLDEDDAPQYLKDAYVEALDTRVFKAPADEILDYRNQLIHHVLHRILKLISPSLRVLYIAYWHREFIFPEVELPHLEDLTMQGDCSGNYPKHHSPLPTLPNLRQLHLCAHYLIPPDELFSAVTVLAPFLTHIRILIRGQINWSFTHTFLSNIIKANTIDPTPALGNQRRFPLTIERIILHPGKHLPPGLCGNAYMPHFIGLRQMSNLVSSSSGRMLMYPLLRYSENHEVATSAAGFDRWLRRSDGDTTSDWTIPDVPVK